MLFSVSVYYSEAAPHYIPNNTYYWVTCKSNQDCNNLHYCSDRHYKNDQKTCQPKNYYGRSCRDSVQCLSGKCENFSCVDCLEDGDCLKSSYCKHLNNPKKPNKCVKTLKTGKTCARSNQCSSRICQNQTCADCLQDSNCQSFEYCSYESDSLKYTMCKRNYLCK